MGMLSFLRDNAKSGLIKFLLYAVAVSFVIGFGAMGYVAKTSQSGQDQWIAKVDDTVITLREFAEGRAYRRDYYRRIYGEQAEAKMEMENIELQVFNELIQRAVLFKEAENKGIRITDNELQSSIAKIPAFQGAGGVFDKKEYIRNLRRFGKSPQEFEESQRMELATSALVQLVFTSAKISDWEVKDYYFANNDKASLKFMTFTEKNIDEKPTVSDEKAKEFFNSNKDNFKHKEERKITYIELDAADFVDEDEVTDLDIENYFNENKERLYKTEQQVQASHILIKFDKEGSVAEMEKARALAEKVQKMAVVKDGVFSKLAVKYSQDSDSKAKGGSIGWITRNKMPPSFSDAAFAMSSGDVSGVIESPNGFHIIKVTGKRDESYEKVTDVAEQIRKV